MKKHSAYGLSLGNLVLPESPRTCKKKKSIEDKREDSSGHSLSVCVSCFSCNSRTFWVKFRLVPTWQVWAKASVLVLSIRWLTWIFLPGFFFPATQTTHHTKNWAFWCNLPLGGKAGVMWWKWLQRSIRQASCLSRSDSETDPWSVDGVEIQHPAPLWRPKMFEVAPYGEVYLIYFRFFLFCFAALQVWVALPSSRTSPWFASPPLPWQPATPHSARRTHTSALMWSTIYARCTAAPPCPWSPPPEDSAPQNVSVLRTQEELKSRNNFQHILKTNVSMNFETSENSAIVKLTLFQFPSQFKCSEIWGGWSRNCLFEVKYLLLSLILVRFPDLQLLFITVKSPKTLDLSVVLNFKSAAFICL